MNIKSLRIFTMIMEKGTLSAAADTLCLSESAASRQLSILENTLGFKLFSREKRQLLPTTEGKAFYHEVEKILYSLEGLPEIAQSIKQGTKSNLRLVTIPRLVRHIVSPVVSQMCNANQDLNIKIDVQGMRYVQRWIVGQQFHLGLGRLPAVNPAIRVEPFCSLPTMVLMAKGHPLSNRSELTIQELQQEPVITLLKGTLLRKNLEDIYQQAGYNLHPCIEVATADHAACIVAAGLGITIADPLVAHNLGTDDICMVPLKTSMRHDFAFYLPVDGCIPKNGKIFIDNVIKVAKDYMNKHNFG